MAKEYKYFCKNCGIKFVSNNKNRKYCSYKCSHHAKWKNQGNSYKIPWGYYCYNDIGICPYWKLDTVHTDEQENGYCEYLKKSDWDLNEEKSTITHSYKQEDGTYKEIISKNISWHDYGILGSLLWDHVKKCDCNLGDNETY